MKAIPAFFIFYTNSDFLGPNFFFDVNKIGNMLGKISAVWPTSILYKTICLILFPFHSALILFWSFYYYFIIIILYIGFQ